MYDIDRRPDACAAGVVDSLADAVHYDRFRSPFSDGFSQFALMFPSDSALGIGPTHARAVQVTRFVTESTLALCLLEDGGCRGVHRQRLTSLPWAAQEAARHMTAMGPLDIEAEHLFLDERGVVSEFRFRNAGDVPVTMRPAWLGLVPPDRHAGKGLSAYEAITPVERMTFVEPVGEALIAGLRIEDGPTDVPQVAIRLRCLTGGVRAWTGMVPLWAADWNDPARALSVRGQGLCYAWVAREPWLLAPGEQRAAQFLLDYAVAWHARPTFAWPARDGRPVDMPALAEERRTLFEARLGTPAVGDMQEQTQLRARYTLLRCGVRGLDGAYGDRLACLCTPGMTSFSVVFFWDALFSAAALADFHPRYAAETIATVLDNPSPTGALAQRRWNYTVPGREPIPQPQAPIGGWAADRLHRLHGDRAALAELYPRIVANHRFWWTRGDQDGDGLAEWAYNGLTADNSPLYDPYGRGNPDHGNFYIPPIASVSLNCFLYRDAMHLARFADVLALPEDAVLWRERARTLFERFMEVCYVERERRFWDYNQQTGTHRRVKTFYLFWPLMADMPIPGDLATELIETVLLDPKQFFGPVPFPSVAYDEPTYDPRGYWRGRAWPHISYWLVELLQRYGYPREADIAADRALAWQSMYTGHRETLCTDPTESEYADGGDFSWVTGRDYDYNWGAACVYMLAGRHYRRAELNPPPSQLR